MLLNKDLNTYYTDIHFIREFISKKILYLEYVCSYNQLANVFTKYVNIDTFIRLGRNLKFKFPNKVYCAVLVYNSFLTCCILVGCFVHKINFGVWKIYM